MKNPTDAVLWCLLLTVFTTGVCLAQNPPSPAQPNLVDQIRQDVARIGVGSKITVIRLNGQESYGSIRRIDADGFQIEDVDQRFTTDFKYNELQGVRKGYGAKGYGGKRLPPSNRKWIILAVVIGALAASIAINHAAHHRNGF